MSSDQPRRDAAARLLDALVAIAIIGAVLYLTPALEKWLIAQAVLATTDVLQECDPPDEGGEILLISVVNRGGRLVGVGCQRVGSQGSYGGPKK